MSCVTCEPKSTIRILSCTTLSDMAASRTASRPCRGGSHQPVESASATPWPSARASNHGGDRLVSQRAGEPAHLLLLVGPQRREQGPRRQVQIGRASCRERRETAG